MQNETFDIQGPAGRLEALLMRPEGEPRAAAVLCHAHPLHGGMMHFKLLFRAAKTLQERGLAVLRFNFRGVGRSEGAHDDGVGEQEDVRAAIDELHRRFPTLPLVAGGFSFGAVMALRVGIDDERVPALLSMGLPIAHMPNTSFLQGSRKPRLFLQGENDEFGPRAAIEALVAPLPEPKSLVIVPGADHYFTGHLDEVQTAIDSWVGVSFPR
jgi:alpha/beta superfamily hydrolase